MNAAPDEHTEIGWFSADALPHSSALDHNRELVLHAMGVSGNDPAGTSRTPEQG